MNHFGSTSILCFLGLLFIQANAIPSWKTCSANSECQATEEYCDYNTCEPCSHFASNSPAEKPSWCIGASDAITVTSTSLLTFVRQAGYNNDAAQCPTFDACAKNCRKEYAVQNSANTITLTSTFADTTDCVCDKIIFYYETDSANDTYHVSGSTNFDTSIDKINLFQGSSTVLDLILLQGLFDECYWEYSIGTVSSTPSSGNSVFGAGLFGIVSALTMMSALILA
jgi:hypothetical protein